MKLTRSKLRKLIKEMVHQAHDENPDKDIKQQLSIFHNLSMQLNDIYNDHRSWDRASDEQGLIDRIYTSREELYAMGVSVTNVNQVKDMSYEQFDALMGMDADELRLWRGSHRESRLNVPGELK